MTPLRPPAPADVRPSTPLGDLVLAALASLAPRHCDVDPPRACAAGCGCDDCVTESIERERAAERLARPAEEPAAAVIRLRGLHRPLVARDEVAPRRRPDARAEGPVTP